MTLEQLNEIKKKHKRLVEVRRVIASEGKKLAKKTPYRKQLCHGNYFLYVNF